MVLAILGALTIGISLGLMGSGGSILTVPILHYVVGQPEKVAIAGSLMIVGSISLIGGLQYLRARLVDLRSVVWFGVPGMAGTYGGAALSTFVTGTVQLVVFELVMLLAAWFMLRPPKLGSKPEGHKPAPLKIGLEGLLVGVLTGFVGVGGGFMIVPALVLFGGLSMQLAVGTSLLIIALKSFTGFVKYLDVLDREGLQLDWDVIWTFIGVGVAGSVVGGLAGKKIPQATLKKAFAGLLLVVGLAMLVKTGLEMSADGPAAAGGGAAGDGAAAGTSER